MYDLVVLGGESEGLSVALAAARIGARVAVVKNATAGDECTHAAVIPRLTLIAAARLAHQIRSAGRYGIRAGTPEVDFAAVMARVRAVAADFASRETDESLSAAGVTVVYGKPVFEAYDTVVVDGKTRLHAQRFVIATGSRPAIPDIPGLAEAGALDEDSFWDLDSLPSELVILGAEATAVEFAQALARLGSKVTVLAGTPTILAREDAEVSGRVKTLLAAEGIAFRTNVEVTSVVVKEGRTVCTVRDKASGASSEVSGTHVLVAAGRLANVEDLDLEAVGIHCDPEHGIEVDEYLQTHSTRILAIGDVIHGPTSTAAAARQVAVVVQNAVLRVPRKIDYSALPWTTFIDPEVASVGLTEAEAHERHPDVRVLRAELAELDRARIDGRTDGFAKLLATPSGKVLGATIVGSEAALVLQEVVLAMQSGLSLQDIAQTFHPYPTYAGLVAQLADEFKARRLDTSLVHKALRWFHGYQARSAADGGTVPEAAGNEHAAPRSAPTATGMAIDRESEDFRWPTSAICDAVFFHWGSSGDPPNSGGLGRRPATGGPLHPDGEPSLASEAAAMAAATPRPARADPAPPADRVLWVWPDRWRCSDPLAARGAAGEAEEDRDRQVMERFLSVLERTPRRGTALDRVYGYHVERGTLDALIQTYTDRAAKDPHDGAAWLLLGLFEAQRGRDAAAVAALRTAEAERKDDPLPAYYLGQALVLVGQPDAAAEALERALGRRPARNDLLEIFQALGRIHQRAHRNEQALAVWTRLESLFPDDARVQEQIASALAEESQLEPALLRYEALAKSSRDAYRRVQFRLEAADLKVRLGRQSDALRDFEGLLGGLDPESWLSRDVRRRIEDVYLRNDDQAGLAAYYERWLKAAPDDVDVMARLGRTLAGQGRAPEARTWLQRAVKLAPSRRELRLALIDQLVHERKFTEAAAQYEAISQTDPNNPDLVRDWGRLLLKDTTRPEAERKQAAAAVWGRLLAARPRDAATAAQVADLYRQAGQSAEAIAQYEKAVALAPDSPQYREYLGEYYHTLEASRRCPGRVACHRGRPEQEPPRTWAQALERGAGGIWLQGRGGRGHRRGLHARTPSVRPAPQARRPAARRAAIRRGRRCQLAAAAELAGRRRPARERCSNRSWPSTSTFQAGSPPRSIDHGIEAGSRRRRRKAMPPPVPALSLPGGGAATPGDQPAIEQTPSLDEASVTAWVTAARLYESAGRFSDAAAADRKLATLDRRARTDYLRGIARLERPAPTTAATRPAPGRTASCSLPPRGMAIGFPACSPARRRSTKGWTMLRRPRATRGDVDALRGLAEALGPPVPPGGSDRASSGAADLSHGRSCKAQLAASVSAARALLRSSTLQFSRHRPPQAGVPSAQAASLSTGAVLPGPGARGRGRLRHRPPAARPLARGQSPQATAAALKQLSGNRRRAKVTWAPRSSIRSGSMKSPRVTTRHTGSSSSHSAATTSRRPKPSGVRWSEGTTATRRVLPSRGRHQLRAPASTTRSTCGPPGRLLRQTRNPRLRQSARAWPSSPARSRPRPRSASARCSTCAGMTTSRGRSSRPCKGARPRRRQGPPPRAVRSRRSTGRASAIAPSGHGTCAGWSVWTRATARSPATGRRPTSARPACVRSATPWPRLINVKINPEENLRDRFRQAREQAPTDPRAFWDAYYLALLLDDPPKTYEAARRPSATGGPRHDPSAAFALLMAMRLRGNTSGTRLTLRSSSDETAESLPALPPEEIELVRDALQHLLLRTNPGWAPAALVDGVQGELKRAGRGGDLDGLYHELLATPDNLAMTLAAAEDGRSARRYRLASGEDLPEAFYRSPLRNRSTILPSQPYYVVNAGSVTPLPAYHMARALRVKADAHAYAEILQLLDAYLTAIGRPALAAERARMMKTNSVNTDRVIYFIFTNTSYSTGHERPTTRGAGRYHSRRRCDPCSLRNASNCSSVMI